MKYLCMYVCVFCCCFSVQEPRVYFWCFYENLCCVYRNVSDHDNIQTTLIELLSMKYFIGYCHESFINCLKNSTGCLLAKTF